MKTLKIFSAVASLFLLALIYFFATVQNPLDKQYDETVTFLTKTREHKPQSELVRLNNELSFIKGQIIQLKKAEFEVYLAMVSPLPENRQDTKVLTTKIIEIKQLRAEIHQRLVELDKDNRS